MSIVITSLALAFGFFVLIIFTVMSGILAGHLIVSLVASMIVALGFSLIAAIASVVARSWDQAHGR